VHSFVQLSAGLAREASKQRHHLRSNAEDIGYNGELSPEGAAAATKSTTDQCLKFMHIPKTGGSSIDAVNMYQDPPVFDSLMLETFQRIATGMSNSTFESKYDSSLGRLYEDSHASYSNYSQMFVPLHISSYNMVQQLDGGTCEDLHTPPSDVPSVDSFYKDGNCDVFCAVREPLQRFISAYEMQQVGPCDPEGFESTLRLFLPQLVEQPSKNGCVFTPQVQFVYGAANKSSSTEQYCHHILHSENLNEEFDAFMEESGQTLTLPEEHLMGEGAYEGCKVDRDNITQAAKDLVYSHYEADYEALGYTRP